MGIINGKGSDGAPLNGTDAARERTDLKKLVDISGESYYFFAVWS